MRKYVYLIRHGECLSNLDPRFAGIVDSLSERGLKQAASVAGRLAGVAVDFVYHSGVHRTIQTSTEIERMTSAGSEAKVFLNERLGSFSPDCAYEYKEDFVSLKSRLREARAFMESCRHRHIVVVSHAVFLKALTAYLVHGEVLTEGLLMDFDRVLVMDNASISKCMFNEEKGIWRIMSWNDTGHLEE